nr:MAG: hypothetical protein [Microvirus sp.]
MARKSKSRYTTKDRAISPYRTNPYAQPIRSQFLPRALRITFKTKTGDISHERTRQIRRSQSRTNTLHHPDSKTVQRRRGIHRPLVPHRRNRSRNALLSIPRLTPRTRTPCSKRAARKSVLFTKRLIGYSGSSPGRNHKYKRTVDSNYTCR